MRHIAILLLTLPVLLFVSCDESQEEQELLKSYSLELIDSEENAHRPFYVGMEYQFQVRVLDEQNNPAQGIELVFDYTDGPGYLDVTNTVSDPQGLVSGVLTLGEGYNTVLISIPKTEVTANIIETADFPPYVEYENDTLLLENIGDTGELFAQVLSPAGELIIGESVNFEATNPDVLSFSPVMTTGSTRQMRVGITAARVGETLVIAKHRAGMADTAYVSVGN